MGNKPQKEENQFCYLEKIPIEVLWQIYVYLEPKDICHFSMTSVQNRQLINGSYIWKLLYMREFASVEVPKGTLNSLLWHLELDVTVEELYQTALLVYGSSEHFEKGFLVRIIHASLQSRNDLQMRKLGFIRAAKILGSLASY